MEKPALIIIIILLLESTYLILHNIKRIQSQNELNNVFQTALQRVRKQGNDLDLETAKYLITDLAFIDSQSTCPLLYEQMLPYVLCESLNIQEDSFNDQPQLNTWREHCYKSESSFDYLSLKTKDNIESKTKHFKICSKTIGPSDYRMDVKNINFRTIFSKTCSYQDTLKRGYVTKKNECSLNSYEQICESDQNLFESQFMIACIDNSSTEAESVLKSVFSCTDDEIACSFSSRFYCINKSEKCPIVDVKVNPYQLSQLEQYGYDSAKLEGINGYLYLKRNDLLENIFTELNIIDFNSDSSTLKNILVNQKESLDNNKNNEPKNVGILHQEINWISLDRLDSIQSQFETRLFKFRCCFSFVLIVEGIFYFIFIHVILKNYYRDDAEEKRSKDVMELLSFKFGLFLFINGIVTVAYYCVVVINDLFYKDARNEEYTDLQINLDYDTLNFQWRDYLFFMQVLPHFVIIALNGVFFHIND